MDKACMQSSIKYYAPIIVKNRNQLGMHHVIIAIKSACETWSYTMHLCMHNFIAQVCMRHLVNLLKYACTTGLNIMHPCMQHFADQVCMQHWVR